jgi:hypothetical protein
MPRDAEKWKESKRKWARANREKRRESSREYREANPEKKREQQRKYYEANKEKVKEYQREYREANPEKVKECHQRHEARYQIKYGESRSNYRRNTNLTARIKCEEYKHSEEYREKKNAAARRRYAAKKAWMLATKDKWDAEKAADAQTGSTDDTTETRPVQHGEMAGDS